MTTHSARRKNEKRPGDTTGLHGARCQVRRIALAAGELVSRQEDRK